MILKNFDVRLRRHRRTKPGNPLRVRVVRVAGANLGDRVLVDVRGGIEIGLADIQAHHIHPARDAPRDVVAHSESVLGTQIAHTGGQQRHQCSVQGLTNVNGAFAGLYED